MTSPTSTQRSTSPLGETTTVTPTSVAIPDAAGAPDRTTPTPVVFRRARTAATLLLLILMVVIGGAAGQQLLRLGGASDSSDQVTRIHEAESEVLAAHQAVTKDVLTATTPAASTPVQDHLEKASALLVEAAAENPSQREAVTTSASVLVRYSGELSAAHRATDPTARAKALATATQTLDEKLAPAFSKAAATETSRLAQIAIPSWTILAAGVPASLLVLLGLVIAANRTHRILSIPLALSLVLTLAATGVAWSALHDLRGELDAVAQRRSEVAQVASARTHLARAKAQEASALVDPSQAADVERGWAASMAAAEKSVASIADSQRVKSAIKAYRQAHASLRSKADAGDVKGAIAAANSTTAGTAGGAYVAAANAASSAQQDLSSQANSNQGRLAGNLGLLCGLALLSALGAVIALWRGFASRLKEYRA